MKTKTKTKKPKMLPTVMVSVPTHAWKDAIQFIRKMNIRHGPFNYSQIYGYEFVLEASENQILMLTLHGDIDVKKIVTVY